MGDGEKSALGAMMSLYVYDNSRHVAQVLLGIHQPFDGGGWVFSLADRQVIFAARLLFFSDFAHSIIHLIICLIVNLIIYFIFFVHNHS